MSDIPNDTPQATDAPLPGKEVALFAPRPKVMRVNRRTLAVLTLLGILLGALVLVAGFSDHTHEKKAASGQENDIRPNTPADAVRALPRDYSFDVQHAFDGVGYGGPAAPTNKGASPSPIKPTADELAAAARRERLEQLRQQMLEQERKELQSAMDSPLVFASVKATKTGGAAGTAGSPGDARGEPIAGTPAARPVPLAAAAPDLHGVEPENQPIVSPDIRANLQPEKEAFLTQAGQTQAYLTKPLIPPLSRYELKAGTVIPGALITGLNTDLPGQLIGQVTQNVYDTVTGHYLLIPQGTRLLGKYQSTISNGQNRALIVWQRLILPNGKSIALDGMPGTDAAGMAGLKDRVDYHAGKLAGSVALSTALAYAGNLARNPSANSANGAGEDVVGDTVAQEANRIGDKIIDRDLNVQPTITIRPGWTFNVLVNADMVLEPYTDTMPDTPR